jgi:hypothetical protein
MMMPGVQKPHEPPVATARQPLAIFVALERGHGTSVDASPASHMRPEAPSTSTVQQPHCPCGAHPSFTECNEPFRSTFSNDSPGRLDIDGAPLHVNETEACITSTVMAPARNGPAGAGPCTRLGNRFEPENL